MLALRPNCECCDKDLPPDASDAMICTFECTFCRDCADSKLAGICPNCGGNLVERPIRPAAALAKYPASTERVFKPAGCAPAAGADYKDSPNNKLPLSLALAPASGVAETRS